MEQCSGFALLAQQNTRAQPTEGVKSAEITRCSSGKGVFLFITQRLRGTGGRSSSLGKASLRSSLLSEFVCSGSSTPDASLHTWRRRMH